MHVHIDLADPLKGSKEDINLPKLMSLVCGRAGIWIQAFYPWSLCLLRFVSLLKTFFKKFLHSNPYTFYSFCLS